MVKMKEEVKIRFMQRRMMAVLALLGLLLLSFSVGAVSGAEITSIEPRNDAEDVPVDGWITIRFDEEMDRNSVEDGLTIRPSLSPYGYRLDWGNEGRELVIKPNAALTPDEEYTVSIEGAEAEDGTEMDDESFTFKTEKAEGFFGSASDLPEKAWGGFVGILPDLLFLIIMLVVGYLVAKAAAWVFKKVLNKAGFDMKMDQVGVSKQLKAIGVKSASGFLGVFIFWFVFIIFLQIIISRLGVPTITNILAPIVLFIPRILIAAFIVFLGLYIANVISNKMMETLAKTEIGKQLMDVDRKTKRSGVSVIMIVSMFIKIFILLAFVLVALDIVNIGILADIITPIILVLPLVLVALFIVLIGIIVSRMIVKTVLKLLREFEIQKLIAPVEETIGRKGIVLRLFGFIIQLMVMLIFIQIAIGVLNSTGAFNMLAELINQIILWMPNVLAALVIILFGFWVAGWISNKFLKLSRDHDVPFKWGISMGLKLLVIYLAGVMAIDQLGFEVPILYIVTAIVLGAVFIGVGAGLAIGSKDIWSNVGGFVQGNKTLRVGSRVTVDEKYSGTIESMTYYATTLKTDTGDKVILPNSILTRSVVVEKGA